MFEPGVVSSYGGAMDELTPSDDLAHKRGRPPGSKNSLRELPDGPVDEMTGLTQRQQLVLIFLRDEIAKRGYPPSMREIGAAVGLASTSSVAHQLRVLEQLGYVKRDPNRPRALEIFLPEVLSARATAITALLMLGVPESRALALVNDRPFDAA